MKTTSKPLIIDEWIWHDLSGENGEDKRKEAIEFLETVYKKCDKIATVKDSKFENKYFNFCQRTDNICRNIIRYFKSYIFFNPEKYISINEEECQQIPENVSSKINPDDCYLVKLNYKLQCPIITTDNPLLKILEEQQIQCKHRDNFLQSYIEKKDI